ncbi:MAG: hypothetical protein RR144_01665 [Clostridia bacterium]
MTEKIKVQYVDKIPKNRIQRLYYFDIRNADMGNGYTIERFAKVNNIGSLVSNIDLLKDKDILTDEEFTKLEIEEVTDLLVKQNELESDMQLE